MNETSLIINDTTLANNNPNYDKGKQLYKENKYYECIVYYKKVYNNTKDTKTKININKYLIKCFEKLDLTHVSVPIENITNHDQIFKLIREGDIRFIDNIITKKYINWNFYDKNGKTPFHYAIALGDIRMTKKMLLTGVNLNQLTNNGNTAFEIACIEHDPNMMNFLINNGVNIDRNSTIRKKLKQRQLLTPDIDLVCILIQLQDGINYNKIKIESDIIDKPYIYDGMTTKKAMKILNYHLEYGNLIDKSDLVKKVIDEELNDKVENNYQFSCPKDKLDNILLTVAFMMDDKFKTDCEWYINYEIMFKANLIRKKLFNPRKSNDYGTILINYRKKLLEWIKKTYIESNLYKENFIMNIATKWLDI